MLKGSKELLEMLLNSNLYYFYSRKTVGVSKIYIFFTELQVMSKGTKLMEKILLVWR